MKKFSEEVKQYARAVHRLTCYANHTDGCGWMYGEDGRFYIYEDVKEKLPELKKVATPEQLHALADVLRPGTKGKEWME